MSIESNVRKSISADMAFVRFRAEGKPGVPVLQVDMDGWPTNVEEHDREVFRAGYAARDQELAKDATR